MAFAITNTISIQQAQFEIHFIYAPVHAQCCKQQLRTTNASVTPPRMAHSYVAIAYSSVVLAMMSIDNGA
jgi:hypothetical protein